MHITVVFGIVEESVFLAFDVAAEIACVADFRGGMVVAIAGQRLVMVDDRLETTVAATRQFEQRSIRTPWRVR